MGCRSSKVANKNDERESPPPSQLESVVPSGQWPYLHRHALVHFIGAYVVEDQHEEALAKLVELRQVNSY